MLTQWLSWAMIPDIAPRGAASLLSQVPETALRHAYRQAAASYEVTGPVPSEFSELPDCVPHALQAIEALPDNDHVQRVGLACIALGCFASVGRQFLLKDVGGGFRAVLRAAARRPFHPELQMWALVAVANLAPTLPRDSVGATLAWEASACCSASLRGFRNAPDVLENAAHALAALLNVHPRRVAAAARAKNLQSVLLEAVERFPRSDCKWDMVHRSLGDALSALERAISLERPAMMFAPCLGR